MAGDECLIFVRQRLVCLAASRSASQFRLLTPYVCKHAGMTDYVKARVSTIVLADTSGYSNGPVVDGLSHTGSIGYASNTIETSGVVMTRL
jgi:hypothetical protein